MALITSSRGICLSKDFVKQCGKWTKNGEELFIITNGKEDTVDRELTVLLSEEGIEMEKNSHGFWGGEPPNSHINGNGPIVAGYKTKGLKVTQLIIIPYI